MLYSSDLLLSGAFLLTKLLGSISNSYELEIDRDIFKAYYCFTSIASSLLLLRLLCKKRWPPLS